MGGEGNYTFKLGLRQGFAAGVRALLNDRELIIAEHSIDGIMDDDITRAFERWWAANRKTPPRRNVK